MSREAWVLTAFILYSGLIIAMAMFFVRSKNLSDYFLGGRSLNSWVGALSAQASDMSGWLLMGLPGAVYAAGTGRAWIAVGLALGTAANWLLIAKRLRRYTITAKNSITLPEYLENRFHDSSHFLKVSAAAFFAIFFTVYTAAGFVAGGTLLSSIFNINYHTGMMIGAAFILAYTLIGGFLAVSWTDTVQGMMMLLAVLLIPMFVVMAMGGWGSVSAAVPPDFFNIMTDGAGGTIAPVSIISDLAWGLGYFGMPHILVRFMAIKSEKHVGRSAVIAIVWVVLALGSAVMVGLVGHAFIPGLDNPETVFIQMVENVFLAPGAIIAVPLLGGLFLCGIFAAIKSTADSQLLVTSSAITGDIYKQINKTASDAHLVWVSRLAVLGVAAVAFLIALDPGSNIMGLVANAWAGFGSAFGPLVILSLYWPRVNRAGALMGVISGGMTVIVWDYIPLVQGATIGSYTGLYSLVPGFFISLAAVVAGSLMTEQPSKAMLDEFKKAAIPLGDGE